MEASAWVRYPFGGERKIQQPKQLKINNNCARNNISRAQEYNTTSGTWYQQKSDFISTFALAHEACGIPNGYVCSSYARSQDHLESTVAQCSLYTRKFRPKINFYSIFLHMCIFCSTFVAIKPNKFLRL